MTDHTRLLAISHLVGMTTHMQSISWSLLMTATCLTVITHPPFKWHMTDRSINVIFEMCFSWVGPLWTQFQRLNVVKSSTLMKNHITANKKKSEHKPICHDSILMPLNLVQVAHCSMIWTIDQMVNKRNRPRPILIRRSRPFNTWSFYPLSLIRVGSIIPV